MKSTTQPTTILTLAAAAVVCSGSLQAAVVIEETFDYDTGAVSGNNGGTGFAGSWTNPKNNPSVSTPGLAWGTLDVAGNYARGAAWSGLIRPIDTTALNDAGLLDNGATLWFSAIMGLEGQNVANADISIALGTDRFVPGVFGDRENLEAGEGIGITHSRGVIQGVYWQDNDADTIAERAESPNSSVTIDGLNGNLNYAFIVGKIEWGADDLAGETLTLYAPDTSLALGSPILAVPFVTPALNQSAFDSLAIQFKDNSQVDEIRFGATSADVLPAIPEPASVVLLALGALGLTVRRCR